MTVEYFGLTPVLDPTLIKITQSDLAAFKRDRRVWFLKTFLGVRPKTTNHIGPLELGTMVHAALEAAYLRNEDMVESFSANARELRETYRTADRHFDLVGWDKQAEQGRVMLEGYEGWIAEHNLDARFETLAVEKQLTIPSTYLGQPVVLTGKVDLIVRDTRTGEKLIFDWKTTANIERTIRQAHTTEQLPYYMTLESSLTGDPATGAAFTILLKSKRTERARPPFYHREFVRYDTRALEARQAGIHGTITDYVRTVHALFEGVKNPLTVAYPNPGVTSFDRDLDSLIDVMDTGGNVAGIIRAHYQQIDPYARYYQPESPLLVED